VLVISNLAITKILLNTDFLIKEYKRRRNKKMNYEAKHGLKLKKSANRLAKFRYMMAERIKKSGLRWKGREAAGKASSGFRPAVK